MRVCFITHTYPPAETAAALYSKNFVSELVKAGIDVVLITASRDGRKTVEGLDRLTIYRVPLKMPIALDFFEILVRVMSTLGSVYEKGGFDLVHSEHLFPSIYSGRFAEKNKLPHVVTIEGVSDVSLYSKALFQYHKFWLSKIKADIIVPWSRFLIDDYFLNWGVGEEKFAVIPSGIDLSKFNPHVNGKTLREQFDESKKTIVSAKPLYYTNALGISYTIRAMKTVSDQYNDCQFIIAGTGRMENFLKRLTRKLNLEDSIKFMGWVPQSEIPKFYNASDVIVDNFIFRHPGSITVLESLASGKPNVLTKIECIPGEDNIPKDEIAMLSNARDEDSIAEGILTLLNDSKLCKQIGNNAWGFVKKNFDIREVAKRYIGLYEGLVG